MSFQLALSNVIISAPMVERSAFVVMHGGPSARHFADQQPTQFDVNSLNPNLMALPRSHSTYG